MATPVFLRKALKREFQKLFNDIYNISIFEQDLPTRKYENEEKTLFPFILIEIESGTMPHFSSENKNVCLVNIIVGVDKEDKKQPEALEVVQKILLRLIENPLIDNKYQVEQTDDLNWSIGQDETEPFEYGVIEKINFVLPKLRQIESEYI